MFVSFRLIVLESIQPASTFTEPSLLIRTSRAEHRGVSSNVLGAQPGYLALPTTKAPETQIYYIKHRSGAFLVLRQRTVARGERASRPIVNRTTALWSIWMVASLILAGSGFAPPFVKGGVAKTTNREALTEYLK